MAFYRRGEKYQFLGFPDAFLTTARIWGFPILIAYLRGTIRQRGTRLEGYLVHLGTLPQHDVYVYATAALEIS